MNYVHVTAEERYQIDDLRREGYSQKDIAAAIGRSESTLSRELRRNKGIVAGRAPGKPTKRQRGV